MRRNRRPRPRGNATHLSATLTVLRQAVGSAGVIETQSYMLNPEYEYHDNGACTLTGCVANNAVRVTLNDPGKQGNVIDAAAQAGATRSKMCNSGMFKCGVPRRVETPVEPGTPTLRQT